MQTLKILFFFLLLTSSVSSFANTDDAQLFLPPGETTKLRTEALKSEQPAGIPPMFIDGFNVDFETQIQRERKARAEVEELERWKY